MHVLLIGDRNSQLPALKRGLKEEGITVDAAPSAAEGDAKARSASFDIIILDLTLSSSEGLSLLKLWRRSGLTSDVLMLTVPGSVPNHLQALDEGADACLAKPFVWAELMARLRALFRRRQQVRSSSQRVGDLEIDPSSRNVKRAGKAITLTPREFSLLQLLVRHRGHVVTRSQIREHLYQKFDDGASNVIDVYIRYLRSKIDKGFDKPLIPTSWGEGYLLRVDPN